MITDRATATIREELKTYLLSRGVPRWTFTLEREAKPYGDVIIVRMSPTHFSLFGNMVPGEWRGFPVSVEKPETYQPL